MKDTITLTTAQRQNAQDLLTQLTDDTEPWDLVDEWRERPNTLNHTHTELGQQYFPVEQIVGTEDHNVTRLVTDRLREIIDILLNNEFEKEHRFPPVLSKIDGEYYVSNDGNHRTLAFKYIGIEEIYAEVIQYDDS